MEADDDYADMDAPVGNNTGGYDDDNFFVRFEDMVPSMLILSFFYNDIELSIIYITSLFSIPFCVAKPGSL